VIALLRGRVAEKGAGYLVLDMGPVGFKVFVPPSMVVVQQVGSEVTLHTQLLVREDGLHLYGFPDSESLELFRRLMGVSGVGPRSAMALISTLGARQLARAIEEGDVSAISRAPGVGHKTAGRIVLELKGRLAGPSSVRADLVASLRELGFKPAEIEAALAGLEISSDVPLDQLLAEALRRLGG
jgi:Holliday junction DNA helicase RuvA